MSEQSPDPAIGGHRADDFDPLTPVAPGGSYHAFLSYSHDPLAEPLRDGLHRFAKSWRQRRAMDVFHDDNALTGSPHLWTTICQALDGSQYLVLLSSPQAAQSAWVGREVVRFAHVHGVERILPVLTDGTWTWDEAAGDFAWDQPEAVTAVHPVLRGRFGEEPRPVDLRWIDDPGQARLDNPRFADAVAQLAAPIRGERKEDLVGEDVRQHRRVRRLTRIAVTVLTALTVIALLSGATAVVQQRQAVEQRDRAQQEARRNLSQGLAARALSTHQEVPDLRLLQAVAADRIESTPASQGALLASLLDVAEVDVLLPGHTAGIVDLTTSRDGELVATADGTGQVRAFAVDGGALRFGPLDLRATTVLIEGDGATVVAIDREGTISWIDVESGEVRRDEPVPDGAVVGFGCDSWGCDLPLAGLEPGGDTVALAMRLDDGRDVVRFVQPDGSASEVEVGEQITGLVWDGVGPLLVSDLNGIQLWDGDEGPTDGSYGYLFGETVGILPGGASFAPTSSDRRGVLTLVRPAPGDGRYGIEWIDVADTGRRWSLLGSRVLIDDGTSTDFDVASFTSVAARTSEIALAGTDPQVGGPLVPQVFQAESDDDSTLPAHWDVPAAAVTRVAAAHDLADIAEFADGDAGPELEATLGFDAPIILGGLDPVARVIGAGNGVLSVTGTPVADAPLVGFDPSAADRLPEVEDLELVRSAVDPNSDRTAGVYGTLDQSIDSTAFDRIPSGPVRIVDGDDDVTPESLASIDASTVAFTAEGELLVGTKQGRIDVYDPGSGDLLGSTQVSEAPITILTVAPDGRFVLMATSEELVLLESGELVPQALLVARRTSGRTGADPRYEVPDMAGVRAGFDDDSNVWFGWTGGTDEFIDGFSQGEGPFGTDEVETVPVLPGLDGATAGFTLDDLDEGLGDPTLVLDEAPAVRLELGGLVERACAVANRDLSDAEWERLAGDVGRVDVCPDLPRPEPAPPAMVRYQPDDRSNEPSTRDVPPEETGEEPSGSTAQGPAAETATEAFEAYLEAEREVLDDGIEYLGSCLDLPTAVPEPATSCLLTLDTTSSEVVAVEVIDSGYRFMVAEGPDPWTVYDEWATWSGTPAPDWARTAMALLGVDGSSSGPGDDGGGFPDEEGFPSGDVFVPDGD